MTKGMSTEVRRRSSFKATIKYVAEMQMKGWKMEYVTKRENGKVEHMFQRVA